MEKEEATQKHDSCRWQRIDEILRLWTRIFCCARYLVRVVSLSWGFSTETKKVWKYKPNQYRLPIAQGKRIIVRPPSPIVYADIFCSLSLLLSRRTIIFFVSCVSCFLLLRSRTKKSPIIPKPALFLRENGMIVCLSGICWYLAKHPHWSIAAAATKKTPVIIVQIRWL